MALGYLRPYRRGTPARSSSGSSLFDLHEQMNRMFDQLFDQDGDSGFYARSGMAAPALDIHQSDDRIEISAELPGVKEDDVDLTIEDGVLTLRGEKKSERSDEERGYSERTYGSFERRISLPANVDEDACAADFENGVLTITLPVSEDRNRGRKIPLGSRKSGNTSEDALIEQDGKKSQSPEQAKQNA